MKIGSHVSMSGKEMLLGSVKEALSYGSTTFMFYTGAPQNTSRKPVSELRIEEAKQLMIENSISIKDIVVHAPYIINLANTVKPETFKLAVDFLTQEIDRVNQIGCSILVLHPGAHVGAGVDAGIDQIIKGLDLVLDPSKPVRIALETMAGKGTEIGFEFEHIRRIIDGVQHPELLGVCLDTCHIHDAGYNVFEFDKVLDDFDRIIGLDQLLVVHVNDSKNVQGAKKDRHENLGYGYIGFETLHSIVNHPQLVNVPKILETPYVDDIAPYKKEIEMLQSGNYEVVYPQKEILVK